MAESTGTTGAASPMGRFRLAGGAAGGWQPKNVLRSSVLRSALPLIIFASACASFLSGANNRIPFLPPRAIVFTGALICPMYFITLLLGGMRLAHELDRRRAAAVLINMAISVPVIFFMFSREIEIIWAPLVLNSPCILWLVHTAPDAMKKFGLRKDRILRDLLGAALITAALSSYMAFTLFCYGFKFHLAYGEFAGTFASGTPMYVAISGFFYMVWDNLRRKGASQIMLIRMMGLLFIALELPLFLPHFPEVAAKAGIIAAVGAMVTGPMLFCIIFSVTFRYCGNSLPAAFTLMMLTQLLNMAGII